MSDNNKETCPVENCAGFIRKDAFIVLGEQMGDTVTALSPEEHLTTCPLRRLYEQRLRALQKAARKHLN